MPVYVDNMKMPYVHGRRRMLMSHMLADSLDELHAMADKIGIKRKWFQKTETPHYDICQSKKALAIEQGAIEISRRQTVEIIRKLRAAKSKA